MSEGLTNNKTLVGIGIGASVVAALGVGCFSYYRLKSGKHGADLPNSHEELMRLDSFDLFGVSTRQLQQLIQHFQSEMEKGLSIQRPVHKPFQSPSSLKMIPSFVELPSGQEKGHFFALDLGGTNFRVIRLTLEGDRTLGEQMMEKFSIPDEIMKGKGTDLFDFIAECVKKFIQTKSPESMNEKIQIGFTFSFPVNQTGVASGTLIEWTKGFAASGVVGQDVVSLLNESFSRKDVKAEIVALVNDTVGTLVARSYQDKKCEMGVILGTGCNACYAEKIANIPKYTGPAPKTGTMIINIEWGAFGDAKSFLPLTKMDEQLDRESINPGRQLFEKMTAGMYLGKIVKNVLLDLFEKDRIFSNCSSLTGEFETEHLSRALSDSSENLQDISDILKEHFNIDTELDDRILVKGVCRLVAGRAARLSATAVAAVLHKIGRLRDVSVAIDGSVFQHVPGFKEKMDETIQELYPSSEVTLVLSSDGSGTGAAVIAATTSKH